jgi:hypothetical protein
MRTNALLFLIAATTAVSMGTATPARAESIIKNPGDHPNYSVELEPHLNLGWARGGYGGFAPGVGFRASIPIVDNGFVKTINNNVAISFGFDWLRYGGCRYWYGRRNYHCGASYFVFPVAMQWNFWLTEKWSVFGEPGLQVYHATFDGFTCDPVLGCPTRTSIDFAFYAGGRFHFNDTVALTMRLGYPNASVGVSFLF